MNSRVPEIGVQADVQILGKFAAVMCNLLCILTSVLIFAGSAAAQLEPELAEAEPVEVELTEAKLAEVVIKPAIEVLLPHGPQIVMRLATRELRNRTLLDLAAAANLVEQARLAPDTDQANLAQRFQDDRAWLQLLVDRYTWTDPRSAVIDPAAWLVFEELQQHEIEASAFVVPGRVPETTWAQQVFQRNNERLAAGNLPFLLHQIEADVLLTWERFINLAQTEGYIDPVWESVESAWFSDQQDLQTPDLGDDPESIAATLEDSLQIMTKLVSGAVYAGPPNALNLAQIRYLLLNRMPGILGENKARAEDILYLSTLIDGLQDGRYIEFSVGLLSVTSRLLASSNLMQSEDLLTTWLVEELPAISALYSKGFTAVDPRLNTVMAAMYSVLRDIADNADSTVDISAGRVVLADAVAQLALLIPDMAYYFDTPVRAGIFEKVNLCISISVGLDDGGIKNMTRQQFEACMTSLLRLAESEISRPELAGNIAGPFDLDALGRELGISPWQRINYVIGYLNEHYSTACQVPASALPNPLEWAVLANSMAWFAENSPVYFQTPENETRLAAMRSLGERLILAMSEQTACLAASGAGINDPVSRGITDYELALRELDRGIANAEADFRTRHLKPGADAGLDQDALQGTGYRPDDLVIEPCDKRAVCEMSGSLSTTRALIGLFSNEYLLAEQTSMGRIEICYRNMEWVQRRYELVRPDDENVSNYYGHLGFDLVGRYVETEASEVFAFRFTSPGEHHYLFAQTSKEVLEDSCPVEWVGSRVVTPLRENRNGIVPNRLTYLAAARKLPSRLLQNNWDRGAEWRDWFVTGIGVSSLEVPPEVNIATRLNQHLQSLYQAEQTEIYQRLLLPEIRNTQGDDVSLFDEMSRVSMIKSLIRMQIMLFYPQSLIDSDAVRMSVAGDKGLLENRILRRFRQDNVALTSISDIAHIRLDKLRTAWADQPETLRRQGSIPASMMHALTRINTLYLQFFTAPPEPLQ